MNIFVLDKDINKSVGYLVDKHTVKMILETAQLLCTAHHICGSDLDLTKLYRKTHENHPCAKWVRESEENYLWTVDYLKSILKEYSKRYGKEHKTSLLLPMLETIPNIARNKGATIPPSCMEEEYKIYKAPRTIDETVTNYRNYYIVAKKHLHSWKTNIPNWINKGEASV